MRFVAFACLLAVATPAFAQDAPEAAPAPKPEKKVCRAFGTTGTIMGGKKICHTKAEWSKIDGGSTSSNDVRTRKRDIMNNLPGGVSTGGR